ncbi:MAG: extracellular solute-binding protein [Clostridia bacterium]|nr:extracellular solute-binding protein [Clostridia bacterium]
MKKFVAMLLAVVLLPVMAFAADGTKTAQLDPSNPVSLTVWHYYNGAQQAAYDELVERFNTTVGKEMGIYVQSFSQGSVRDLETAVINAVDGVIGAEPLPNIFSTYADTASAVQKKCDLVDLKEYFTEEELSAYVDSYIGEGYFNNDGHLYLFPVAKSTEILMINATDWEDFAEDTGSTLEELSTVEGIVRVADRYYDWTDAKTPDVADDGKAFYGRDSVSNYFILGTKQMGVDIFTVKDGQLTINADKELMRRLWENFYVPFVRGRFDALGKFRSDDVKTGDLLCYTGSSSSAMYFPDTVETDDDSIDIDHIILPAPMFENGDNYIVQQGAGMVVTKSDDKHEYAAAVFLKWFTQPENSLRFVVESSYMPVRKDAHSMEMLDKVIADNNLRVNSKSYDCLKVVIERTHDVPGYYTAVFPNGSKARSILDYNLLDQAKEDKAAVDEQVALGVSREDAAAPYITDEAFEAWYEQFVAALHAAAFNE